MKPDFTNNENRARLYDAIDKGIRPPERLPARAIGRRHVVAMHQSPSARTIRIGGRPIAVTLKPPRRSFQSSAVAIRPADQMGDDTVAFPFRAEVDGAAGYGGLILALRRRCEQLNIATSGNINALAGLPGNYLGKLLAPSQPRRLGAISWGPVFSVLGLKLVIVHDEEAFQQVAGRLEKRQGPVVRDGVTELRLSRRFMRKIGAKGKQMRWSRLSTEQRTAWAREMNRIRWAKARASQASAVANKRPRVRSEQRGEIAP